MLQAINDRIKGWLGAVIVVLIGLPFAFWGIQSYLDDSGPIYAAKVNGVEISANEFERMVSMQRQSMLQQYGGKLPFEDKVLREQTLTQLINQRLLEGSTYDSGYRISDAVLSARIQQMFTIDGIFDRDRFEASVASFGMTIPMYEQSLRSELRMQQMQNAIADSSFVTRKEINRLASLDEQTRDITVLTFDVDHFSTAKAPTEDEIKQYYEANMQRFMEPEKVKVDYVEIVSETLSNTVEVDESQIQKMYEEYLSIVKGREERKARHILLETSSDKTAAKDKIESIRQQIENGADFADLAKQYSDDKGSAAQGGDLGWVALGDMVKPFENALFEMELSDSQASVSEVVETQFGYHLIKLEDIRSEAVEPLAVKRYEFEEELKADSVASLFYDLSERLASTAYENPDSLDAVVEELGLKVTTTDYFTRNSGKGIADNAKVRDIAYSSLVLEQGSNSDIIEISPTHVVVIRLNEHVPAKAIPLENVSARIETILKAESGHEQTRAAALDVKSRIEAGESISDLQTDGINIEDITSLGRMDNSKISDPTILRTAFDMTSAEDGKAVIRDIDLMSGDVALVVLNKVNIPESVGKDKLDLVKNTLRRENSVRDFSNVLLSIKENADIDKNRRMLDR